MFSLRTRFVRQRNKKKLDKKIKKERKNIARLEAKLNKKKAIHKNNCQIKELHDEKLVRGHFNWYNRLDDNIDQVFLFAKMHFETKWPQFAINCVPGTVEYYIWQKARKYKCGLQRLEIYLGHKYGYPTGYQAIYDCAVVEKDSVIQEINEELCAEKISKFNKNRKQRIKRALQYRGLIKKTIYDKTINKWSRLYKGIVRKSIFEKKLWLEKEKNKILTESLNNYLKYIRQYASDVSHIY
tara:strand:+ start:250 stop:969 length:720 start_codon:yes stop_codon:yes gene_type:complete